MDTVYESIGAVGQLRPKLWLDASQEASLGNGAAVSSWIDRSGNGNHAVQATGSNQPIYRTLATSTRSLPNGLPVMDFDGVNDTMLAPFVSSYKRTVFIVTAVTAVSTARNAIDGAGAGRHAIIMSGGGIPAVQVDNSNVLTSPRTPFTTLNGQEFRVLGAWSDGTSQAISIDGSVATGLTTGVGDLTGLYIGSFNGSGAYWPGMIAEVVAFDRMLLPTERALLVRSLREKWATV